MATSDVRRFHLAQRVPYLVKLLFKRRGATFDSKFDTIVTRDLISALLRGEKSSQDMALRRLDSHGKPIDPTL